MKKRELLENGVWSTYYVLTEDEYNERQNGIDGVWELFKALKHPECQAWYTEDKELHKQIIGAVKKLLRFIGEDKDV